VFSSNARQLGEWLARGQYSIGLGVQSTEIARLQQDGVATRVKAITLPEGARVTPSWGGRLLLNRPPRPNATKVFANWLLGREGQAHWAEASQDNSRRLDVPPGDAERRPDPAKLDRHFNFNNEENGAFREETLEPTKKLLGG